MSQNILVGYTGFIGSHLIQQGSFDLFFNSKNIKEISNREADLLVCAGVSAMKWFANQEPLNDLININYLKENLLKARFKKIVLISTVDIYDYPLRVTETDIPDPLQQDPYGKHRYQLEQWIIEHFEDYHILRLPAVFGKNLKKNLIYDILNPLAKSINKSLWEELQGKLSSQELDLILTHYDKDEFGNLRLCFPIPRRAEQRLLAIFESINFSTLSFTDSRSSFQFYNVENLWNDVQFAINHHLRVLNVVPEPVEVRDLIKYVLNRNFENYTVKGPVVYDVHTKFSPSGYYLYKKDKILSQIKRFVFEEMKL